MNLNQIFKVMFDYYGPQHWWPGDSPFEIMVGAILTQNTAWTNVEKAISNLIQNEALEPVRLVEVEREQLAEWLRPSGYFNIKAQRLQNFVTWYVEQGGFDKLSGMETNTLRKHLLSVNGVGRETADDMLLYAFERPVFVIDAYTRRIFGRLDYVKGDEHYEELRRLFETELDADVGLFNEFHALIVIHAKDYCTKRKPRCSACCLRQICQSM